MKNFIKEKIKKLNIEKNLIEIATRMLIKETPSDFENIKKSFVAFMDKEREIESTQSLLEYMVANESKKLEEAKKLAGIGGNK